MSLLLRFLTFFNVFQNPETRLFTFFWLCCIRFLEQWIRLRFDCNSTALRPFDDLRYDRTPSCCGLLHVCVTAASELRHCDLNDL